MREDTLSAIDEEARRRGSVPDDEDARLPVAMLIRGADVQPEPISWLWDGWLAAGKFHILAGPPGTGKTTLAQALMATVSCGGRWPDGSRSEVGNVVIWSGEDDPSDTLVPRLIGAGADMERVFIVDGVRIGGERLTFDPAQHISALIRAFDEIGNVRLLVVDPVVSAVAADSHKNTETRRDLQPLVDLAAARSCAVLGITHFTKGSAGRDPVDRVTGSLAFGAVARVVMAAVKRQETGEDGKSVRLFARAKSNIGPDDGGFEYELLQTELAAHPGVSASVVLWGDPVQGSARELLAAADKVETESEGGALEDAKRFLLDALADGPVLQKVIKQDSDGAGHSWATIRRAKDALGIVPTKNGMAGGWVWQTAAQAQNGPKVLRKTEGAQPNNVSTFGKVEHLRAKKDCPKCAGEGCGFCEPERQP